MNSYWKGSVIQFIPYHPLKILVEKAWSMFCVVSVAGGLAKGDQFAIENDDMIEKLAGIGEIVV